MILGGRDRESAIQGGSYREGFWSWLGISQRRDDASGTDVGGRGTRILPTDAKACCTSAMLRPADAPN